MAGHTPGPWKAHHGWASDDKPLDKHPDWCEVVGGSHEDGNYITICGHFGMANARLIAAAPDLLEALRGLLKYGTANDAPYADFEKAARAAIAKATP